MAASLCAVKVMTHAIVALTKLFPITGVRIANQ